VGPLGGFGAKLACLNCGEQWKLGRNDLQDPWRRPHPKAASESDPIDEDALDAKWTHWAAGQNDEAS
jgi:hypothetical protein